MLAEVPLAVAAPQTSGAAAAAPSVRGLAAPAVPISVATAPARPPGAKLTKQGTSKLRLQQPVELEVPQAPPGVRGGTHLSDMPPAAASCKVEGTGLSLAIVRQAASFTIDSRDAEGTPLHKGGAKFFVAVRGSALVHSKVRDNDDGTYTCEYKPHTSGKFTVAVSLDGVALPGSPYALSVVQPRPDPSHCVLSGEGLLSAVAREPTTFSLEFVDVLGQMTHAEDVDVWVELLAKAPHYEAPPNLYGSRLDAAAGAQAATAAADGGEGEGAAVDASSLLGNSAAEGLNSGGGASYAKLDAGERQKHLQLWARRLAADRAIAAASAANATKLAADSQAVVAAPITLNLVNEMSSDDHGVGFAFGGVDPGTLKAKGQLFKRHTVHYSIGRAGTYKLHVGLRQQSAPLPGSPFMLTIKPGSAYAPSTRLPARAVEQIASDGPGSHAQGSPNKGTPSALANLTSGSSSASGSSSPAFFGGGVGLEWYTMTLVAADKMGNHCIEGGANVTCESPDARLNTKCVDNSDGTYLLGWRSETASTYALHVKIDGIHVIGSPTALTMLSTTPCVACCEISGVGLSRTTAGKPASIRVRLKDKFKNASAPRKEMTFGLAMLPSEVVVAKPDKKEKRQIGAPTLGARSKEAEASAEEASLMKAKLKDRFKDTDPSMAFEGTWVGNEYEIRYIARDAGDFELNVWAQLDKSAPRERLPGAPFVVHVTEARAHASGSLVEHDIGEKRTMTAGEKVSLKVMLRDQYNNASNVGDEALTATLEAPDGTTPLAFKPRYGAGEFEAMYETKLKGTHKIHVKLAGADVQGSPITFSVVPAQALASKSMLNVHTMEVPLLTHNPCNLLVQLVDRFGNTLEKGGARVDARALGAAAGTCTTEDRKDGTYLISFQVQAAGDYKVSVRLENKDELAPLTLNFVAGQPKPVAEAPAAAPAVAPKGGKGSKERSADKGAKPSAKALVPDTLSSVALPPPSPAKPLLAAPAAGATVGLGASSSAGEGAAAPRPKKEKGAASPAKKPPAKEGTGAKAKDETEAVEGAKKSAATVEGHSAASKITDAAAADATHATARTMAVHVGASTAPEGDDHASTGDGGSGGSGKQLKPKKEKGGASPAKKAKDKEGGGKSARPKDKAEDKDGGGKSARPKGLKSPPKTPKKQKSSRFDPDTMDGAAEKLKSAMATEAVPGATPTAKKPPKAPMPKGAHGKDAQTSESGLAQLPQAAALPPQPVSFEPLADARADGTFVDPPTAAEQKHSTETPAPKYKQNTDRGITDLRARIMSRGF